MECHPSRCSICITSETSLWHSVPNRKNLQVWEIRDGIRSGSIYLHSHDLLEIFLSLKFCAHRVEEDTGPIEVQVTPTAKALWTTHVQSPAGKKKSYHPVRGNSSRLAGAIGLRSHNGVWRDVCGNLLIHFAICRHSLPLWSWEWICVATSGAERCDFPKGMEVWVLLPDKPPRSAEVIAGREGIWNGQWSRERIRSSGPKTH